MNLFKANSADAALTLNSLETMLTGLAYEPKLFDKYLLITLSRDSWENFISLCLSENRESVWLVTRLGNLPGADPVPASSWLRLLQENSLIGPAHFVINENALFLHRALENRGITPVRLRKQIDEFDAVVRRTVVIWHPKNFGVLETKPASANSQITSIMGKPPWPAI